MAATILSTKIKIAGTNGLPQMNAVLNVFRVYGASIAASDTGTIVFGFKPLLDANGVPLIIGLPHGITKTYAASTGTLTLTAVGTFTNLDQEIFILGVK